MPAINIQLTHPFKLKCHSLQDLLVNCTKLSTFCTRLERQASLFPDRYDPLKYKGDGFELFCEALIKLSPMDNRIGIGRYSPFPGLDLGTDGIGTGTNGKPATVQCKYKSKKDDVLTANEDHLSNFVVDSVMRRGVDPLDINNMLILTTARGLHYFTDGAMYDGKVRCLGFENIRSLVDNNLLFWSDFSQLCSA